MKHNYWILFIIVSFAGCSNDTEKVIAQKSKEINESKILEDDWEIYTWYTDLGYDSLKIKWLDKNSFEFRFKSGDSPCTFEMIGTAKNQGKTDPEIIDGFDGLAIAMEEYFVVDGQEFTSILIDLESRNFAKIKYQYADIRDECDPDDQIIMKKTGY